MLKVGGQIDAPHDVKCFPVVEGHALFVPQRQQPSSEDSIALLLRLERFDFLKVLVNFDSAVF